MLEDFAGLFELDDGSFGQQLIADLQTIVDGLRGLHIFQKRLDGKTTSFRPGVASLSVRMRVSVSVVIRRSVFGC